MLHILDHPDAPHRSDPGEYVVEPVAPDEIERHRDAGEHLVETPLVGHPDMTDYVRVGDPKDPGNTDIGDLYYRFTQLFGTPNLPEYVAGRDISWRTNDVFKYLLRVRRGVTPGDDPEEADAEYLLTAYDEDIELRIGLAEWREDPDAEVEFDPTEVLSALAVVVDGVNGAVACEADDTFY
jgi:hypothetical protein